MTTFVVQHMFLYIFYCYRLILLLEGLKVARLLLYQEQTLEQIRMVYRKCNAVIIDSNFIVIGYFQSITKYTCTLHWYIGKTTVIFTWYSNIFSNLYNSIRMYIWNIRSFIWKVYFFAKCNKTNRIMLHCGSYYEIPSFLDSGHLYLSLAKTFTVDLLGFHTLRSCGIDIL